MEPERDIEKELKAYARQRRAAAGTPPPLHPANRKALQAEAARLAKSSGAPSRPWWQMFFGSWPRLAVAGAAVAVVVIVTLHSFSPPKSRHEGFQSSADKREQFQSFAATRRSPEEPKAMPATPPPARPRTQTAESSAAANPPSIALDTAASPASPPTVAPVAAPAIVAPAPAPVATSAATPPPTASALALNAPVSRDRESSSSSGQVAKDVNGFAQPAGTVGGGAIAGSPAAFNRLTTADAPATLVTQRFRRTDLPARATKAFNASNLLASFKVEQDLGKLRVTDGDGSVYYGFVEQTPEDFKQSDALLQKKVSEKEIAGPRLMRPLQAFRFRVTGTNRTLKEEVVFTGNFLAGAPQPLPAAKASGGAASATVAPGATSQPVLFELQKARMEGRLLLGGTNKIEIKAAPVKR